MPGIGAVRCCQGHRPGVRIDLGRGGLQNRFGGCGRWRAGHVGPPSLKSNTCMTLSSANEHCQTKEADIEERDAVQTMALSLRGRSLLGIWPCVRAQKETGP